MPNENLPDDIADELDFLFGYIGKSTGQPTLHTDALLDCQRLGDNAWLTLGSPLARQGAISATLGQSLEQALEAVRASHRKTPLLALHLSIPISAGADTTEPLLSLFYINRVLESLWQVHRQGIRIEAMIDSGCYGGTSIIIAACADDILLGPTTVMTLLGPRVLTALSGKPLPPVMPLGTELPTPPRLRRIAPP